MAFPTNRQETLNSLVVTVLRQQDATPTDVVTIKKPLWRAMANKAGGMIETRPPNIKGFPERLMYKTEANIFTLSATQDFESIDYTQPDPYTEANYYWLQDIAYLSMGKFRMDNTPSKETLVNYVMSLKRAIEIAMDNNLNKRLFEGHVAGGDAVFGIRDLIQLVPTTAPAKGLIGDLDITQAAVQAFWVNNVANFNTAYKTISSTGVRNSVLGSGDPNGNDLLSLWMDCANNDAFGKSKEEDGSKNSGVPGEPDFLLCNDVLYKQITDLTDDRLLFVNQADDFQLGVKGFWFRSALVMWEPNVTTYTAGRGTGWYMNTDAVKFVKAQGLERRWGDMAPVPGQTGFGWPYSCQYSVSCNDRRKLGVIYNVLELEDNTT